MKEPTSHATWVWRALVFAIVAHVVVGAIDAAVLDNHAGDFDRFWDIASSAGRPYRDYAVEYPPGALYVFKVLARMSGGLEVFRYVLLFTNFVADGAIVGALAWGWGIEAAACFGLVALPVFSLLGFHVDLWSAACATIAVAAWWRERPALAAAALFGGVALKLWPLPFAVLLLAPRNRHLRLAPALMFAIAVAGLALFWWFLAGWAGFHEVLTFRDAHGWQVESMVGSVLRVLDGSSERVESGAVRVGSLKSAVTIGLFLVAALPSLWALDRGARRGGIGSAWLAGVGVMLVCSTLLSPQFIGWLLPGVAIAWMQQNRRLTVLFVPIAIITAIGLGPFGIVLRNALLLALTTAAVVAVWNRPRPAVV